MGKIKYFIMDVDGTLTDGKIYMDNNGEIFKAFDVKDGYAISSMLRANEITPIIITGRMSRIVERRAMELNISEVYQGVRDKAKQLKTILRKKEGNYTLCNVAYIGDDLNDMSVMLAVKQSGGMVGCPADGAESIKKIANFISSKNGGNGAVREFIEQIIIINKSEKMRKEGEE